VSANFRGENAAASLKPLGDFVFGEAIAGIIRGIRAAASLKLHAQCAREDGVVGFPRRKCRGLIEAIGRRRLQEIGSSRQFAATPYFGRFRGEADID
jgi:hypothetical protein